MSNKGAAGIRAAKDLLELLDEHSAEEFEAATTVLGSQQELANILRLLAEYQRRAVEPDPKAKTVDDLVEVVRAELLRLEMPPATMARIAQETIEDFADDSSEISTAISASAPKTEDVVQQALERINNNIDAPREQMRALIEFVLRVAHLAGREEEEKVADSLRALTVEALAGNVVMFSDIRALADLRLRWSTKPLAPVPGEPRRHLASRLLNDAQMRAPESYRDIMEKLLLDGLRSPTDTARMLMRRMGVPKANPPTKPLPTTAQPRPAFAKPTGSARKLPLLKKAK